MEASQMPAGEAAHKPGEDQITSWEITTQAKPTGLDMVLETECQNWLAKHGLDELPAAFRTQFDTAKECATAFAEMYDADAVLKFHLGGTALPGGERKVALSVSDYQ